MLYGKACTHPCSVLPTVSLCARAAQRALGHGICSNSAAVLLHRTAVPCPGARPERRERNERGEGALAACPGPHHAPATSCSATASPSRAVTSSRCRGNRACAERGGVRAGSGRGQGGAGGGVARAWLGLSRAGLGWGQGRAGSGRARGGAGWGRGLGVAGWGVVTAGCGPSRPAPSLAPTCSWPCRCSRRRPRRFCRSGAAGSAESHWAASVAAPRGKGQGPSAAGGSGSGPVLGPVPAGSSSLSITPVSAAGGPAGAAHEQQVEAEARHCPAAFPPPG